MVIPARYQSSRLPGKPLIDLAGKTMIERVYRQACKSAAREVYIATDDVRIQQVAQAIGAKVVMTRDDHESGTDRIAEVVGSLALADDEIVVNVQGDEPLIPPSVIDQVAQLLLSDNTRAMATLSEKITSSEDFFDPNVVKVVTDNNDNAVYFSRAPIPWPREAIQPTENGFSLPDDTVDAQRHIGIYAYRAGLLSRFVTWPVAALEQTEKLEQLRVMAQGEKIGIAVAAESPPPGIDTPKDVQRTLAILQQQ